MKMLFLNFYQSEDAQFKTKFPFKISNILTILIFFELRKRFKDVFVFKFEFLENLVFFLIV